MLWALRQSWLVLTDSGGIQEEAAALDRPVLVLRKTTERPELIEAGGGALVGASGDAVRAWLRDLTTDAEVYGTLRCETNPYGDGHAADRIADVLTRELAAPQPAEALLPVTPLATPSPIRPVSLSVLAA